MMTKLKRSLKTILTAMMFGVMLLPAVSFAATTPPVPASGTNAAACDGAKAVGATCTDTGLKGSLTAIFEALFYIIGAIAVLIIILAGIYYITSTGDSARIKRAKDTMLYAVIGLALTILARAIVGFVIGRLA